ncbi:MAG: acyl-CoA dehydrogenase family protein [Hyphomonadaceae bacterium]|nr:acyl-CoA dehydrogenase family protein [Hyphomonadaceae bacterium]
MSFALDEDLTLLKDTADGFFSERAPVSAFRAMRDAGATFDEGLAGEIAALGLTAALLPEAAGGSGMGFRAVGLALEAEGRTLAVSPLLQTGMIGAGALKLFGTPDQQAHYGAGLADGSIRFALAIDEGPRHDPRRCETVLVNGAVTGTKMFVQDGGSATHLLVAARDAGADVLAVVPADASGVSRTARTTVDHRDCADVIFDVAVAEAILPLGDDGLEGLLDVARAGVAAQMLGVMGGAFDMTNDYLKTRTQFGQLIGSFQGLQHRAAAMLVEMELTRSCVIAALLALDSGKDAREAVSIAKARAGDTLQLVTNETIQFHGGIGMTDAHDSGFYIKRARVLEALYGNAAFHRDRYARLNGY